MATTHKAPKEAESVKNQRNVIESQSDYTTEKNSTLFEIHPYKRESLHSSCIGCNYDHNESSPTLTEASSTISPSTSPAASYPNILGYQCLLAPALLLWWFFRMKKKCKNIAHKFQVRDINAIFCHESGINDEDVGSVGAACSEDFAELSNWDEVVRSCTNECNVPFFNSTDSLECTNDVENATNVVAANNFNCKSTHNAHHEEMCDSCYRGNSCTINGSVEVLWMEGKGSLKSSDASQQQRESNVTTFQHDYYHRHSNAIPPLVMVLSSTMERFKSTAARRKSEQGHIHNATEQEEETTANEIVLGYQDMSSLEECNRADQQNQHHVV